MRRTLTTTATVAAAAFALAGCSSTGSTVNTTPAGASATAAGNVPTKPAPATAAPVPKKAGIGSTIDLAGQQAGNVLEVTLVKIVDPAPPANQFAAAGAGKHLVGVQLRIANKGHAAYQADPQMATKLKDATGETFTASITSETSAGQAIDSGLNLAVGDTSLGFVVFEVPDGTKVTQVQYAANTFGGNVAQWTVG